MAHRGKFWRNMIRAALTQEEWIHTIKMLDRETKQANEAGLYDIK